jgi:hypothetical protein
MTQNMEKYYGLRIEITEELNPEKLDQLIKVAPHFMHWKGYDPDDYYLYCHQTSIIPNKKHWSRRIPIEERIESLNLRFSVNKKQLPKVGSESEGRIHFYNWRCSETPIEDLLGMPLGKYIEYIPAEYEMNYSLGAEFIKEHRCFRNLILTVIDKRLRLDHRKIKLHISAIPTDEYKSRFKNESYERETALDCYFQKPVEVEDWDEDWDEHWDIRLVDILPEENLESILFPEKGATEMVEKYVDFDLRIEANGHAVASSPEGEAKDYISIPEPNSIRLALQLIERRETNANLLKDIGRTLYDWLFPGAIHTHFQQTEAVARRDNAKLRLRLRIESPIIAGLPLEFVYRDTGGYFLAVNPATVFSRYLDLPLPQQQVRRREDPLHILAIISDPIDQVRLVPDEWEAILKEALNTQLLDGRMTLQTVKRATNKEIRNALLKQKPDIVQFVGHGIYQNGKGYLALVHESTNQTVLMDDEQFANIFLGFNDNLGLISMATCESAQSDDPQSFLGIAPQLVQRGAPAVVAMQYSVYIKTAKVFLEDFYTCIAAHKPIDWAVQSARKAISSEFGLDNREFATPVLYMRAKDGSVF